MNIIECSFNFLGFDPSRNSMKYNFLSLTLTMKKRHLKIKLFFWCYFLALSFLIGQEKGGLVKGIILDSLSENVIENVSVRLLKNATIGSNTNDRGLFEFQVEKFPIQVQCSHLNYISKIVQVDSLSTPLIIRLSPKENLLPEISVTALAKIDTIFQESYSVIDYEFHQNKTFLLAYKDHISKYSLIALDEQDQVVARRSLRDKRPVKLHKNCLGKIQLVTTTNAYEIVLKTDSFSLENRRSLEDFDDFWEPCILANEEFVYFSRYHFQGQALQYYAFPKKDTSQFFLLPRIEDDRNIVLLLEDLGIRLPYSGELWQENVSYRLAALRDAGYQLQGFQKILYKPLYAPLVEKDTQLCIFNHLASELQYLNRQGDTIKTVPIDYHQSRKWKKKILYDEFQQKAYTTMNSREGEIIYRIDMDSGQIMHPISINRVFIENLKIRNGYLYFLYRNIFVKDRNRKLHKLRLN